MRAHLPPFVERARIVSGSLASDPNSGPQGAFLLPGPLGNTLSVVASNGRDWKLAGLAGEAWQHVSVSLPRRCPTWREMEWVREQFFNDDELVLQFSVPREKHINHHDYCLHLWKPTETAIPLPPMETV